MFRKTFSSLKTLENIHSIRTPYIGVVARAMIAGKRRDAAELMSAGVLEGHGGDTAGLFLAARSAMELSGRSRQATLVLGRPTAENAMPAAMIAIAADWTAVGISPRTTAPITIVTIGTHGMKSDAVCVPSCLTM